MIVGFWRTTAGTISLNIGRLSMAFCTPADIALKPLPKTATVSPSITVSWPPSPSFCCWPSRCAPPLSIAIPNSFAATASPLLKWLPNCGARSLSFHPTSALRIDPQPASKPLSCATDRRSWTVCPPFLRRSRWPDEIAAHPSRQCLWNPREYA